MRRYLTKLIFTATVSAGVLVSGATGASAQEPPDCTSALAYFDTASLQTTPTTVEVGQQVTVTGTGFPPNTILTLFLDGSPLAEVTTDASGAFSFTFTAQTAGTLSVTTVFCGAEVSTIVTVTTGDRGTGGGGQGAGGGGTSSGGTSLPRTGSDSTDLARVGVVLLGGGAIAVAATRRRKAAAVSS